MRVRRMLYVLALVGLACASVVLRWSVAEAQVGDGPETDGAEIDVRFGYGPHPPHVGDAVGFVNLSVGDVSYRWDFGDGFESIERHPTHIYEDAGPHEVVLTACGPQQGSCAEYESTIWVQPAGRTRRAMSSDFTSTPEVPRAGTATTFTAEQRSRVSLWRVPALGIASDAPGSDSLEVVFPTAGTYVVEHLNCWSSSDSLRCDRSERTIEVGSQGEEPKAASESTMSLNPSDDVLPDENQATPTRAPQPASAQIAVRVAPANVRYDGFLGAPAALRWTDTNKNETGYRIYATRNDLVPEEIGLRMEVPADTTRARFFEFSSAYSIVCYEVVAVFADGAEGPPSAEVCHAQPGSVTAATNVSASPGGYAGAVDVRWTAEVSNTVRFWLCTSAATYTDSVAIDRDEFSWEVVDGESIIRGYERTLVGLPNGETVTIEVHPDPINGGRCLGTGVATTITLPETTAP